MRTLITHAREWSKTRRQARQHLDLIEETRGKGLWPRKLAAPPSCSGRTVYVFRYDRFGDMMLTLPFLARLLAADCDLRVYTESKSARDILVDVGIRCSTDMEDSRHGSPDLVLLLKPCRNFRAPRHPERWQRLEKLLEWFRGTPFVIPAVFPGEAMSHHIDVFGSNPFAAPDALTLLRRFGDGLQLPVTEMDLLAGYAPADRGGGCGVAINLSAGTGSRDDRRYIPTELWAQCVERIRSDLEEPISFVVLPEDLERRRQIESAPFAERFAGIEVACPNTIVETARWLAGQRMLLSPDTGLCHLARTLDVPLVAAVPPKLVSYWYPPSPRQETVPTKFGRDLDVSRLVAATKRLLARHAEANP